MIIDKSNKTKDEVLKFIAENKTAIMKMKRETLKHADPICLFVIENKTQETTKQTIQEQDGESLKTIVANTYGWMDSHDDVHMEGCFKKSLKENKNVFHLHDHEFKLTSQVGDIKSMKEQKVSLKALGLNQDGEAECLVIQSLVKEDYNEFVYQKYNEGEINQHSVGMRYVNLFLCVDSEAPGWETEKKNWNKYIDQVINKDKAVSYGYFWAVTEAKLIEVSCVLLGSNELTPTLEDENKSTHELPLKDTEKKEPLNASNESLKLARIFLPYHIN